MYCQFHCRNWEQDLISACSKARSFPCHSHVYFGRNTNHLPETQGKVPFRPFYDSPVTGLPEFSEDSCLLVSGVFQSKSLLDCICIFKCQWQAWFPCFRSNDSVIASLAGRKGEEEELVGVGGELWQKKKKNAWKFRMGCLLLFFPLFFSLHPLFLARDSKV